MNSDCGDCGPCGDHREMYEIINSMVKYECGDCGYCEDCMKNKGSFNYELHASNNKRIIIQRKYPSNNVECSICFDELFNKSVSYLPCKHLFHSTCLSKTFENKIYSCPLCRSDLTEALNKINFEFPPPQPESLSDLDIHVINQILNPMNYLPYYHYYYYSPNRREQLDSYVSRQILLFDSDHDEQIIDHLMNMYTFLTSDSFQSIAADGGAGAGADTDSDNPPPLVSDYDSEPESVE